VKPPQPPPQPVFTISSPVYDNRSVYDDIMDLDDDTYIHPSDEPDDPATAKAGYQNLNSATTNDYTVPGATDTSNPYQLLDTTSMNNNDR